MEQQRPEIPKDDYMKPMSKGGDLPPLSLLPDREWLAATITKVEYRYAMFNGQIQYVTRTELDEETGKEIEVPVTDIDGNKIARKEFNIKFELRDYELPNSKGPRCCWLTMGASMGEKAHLPMFLFNVLGPNFQVDSPNQVISALTGKKVKIQLKNKPNKKDPTMPPYQNVIYDAVIAADKTKTMAPAPMPENNDEDKIPF